jgi:RNA polymerase sporulation-specific sigma factor
VRPRGAGRGGAAGRLPVVPRRVRLPRARRTAPAAGAPAAGGLPSGELARLCRAAARGDRAARERIVAANLGLVRHVVRRFRAMGLAEEEELFQVGVLGLLKAVDRFDPERGTRLSTYAVPLILGEIQRYLRDVAPAGPGRGAQRLAQAARAAEERLAQQLRRPPTVAEVAAELGVSAGELAAALEAARRPASLDEVAPSPEGEGRPLHERLPAPGGEWDRALVRVLLARLPPRERQILVLRYYRDLSQAEVGALLGLSQPQVSRVEQRALQALRRAWLGAEARSRPGG